MKVEFHPVIVDLIHLIQIYGWEEKFNQALASVLEKHLDEYSSIHNLNDWFLWCHKFLYWIPEELDTGNTIESRLLAFWFFFYQPSLRDIERGEILQAWIHIYARELEKFYDSVGSLTTESLRTFYETPEYRMEDYMEEPSGWKTFNQFFARNIKPGYRPIDFLCDDRIIVSPVDAIYKGYWKINKNLKIEVKGISWSIGELLQDIPYAEYFREGSFTHLYLNTTDYHRYHTPMAGKVLYKKIIQGNLFMEVYVNKKGKIARRRTEADLITEDSLGFQFTQTRGVLILETLYGLIALIPVGMCFVSSIILTADVGSSLHKGENMGYFQFGASDFIILFSGEMNLMMTAIQENHYDQGMAIAQMIEDR